MAPTLYRVDRNDTMVQVNDAWDEFAAANAAPDLAAAHVLQRSLWSFVSDATVRLLYREIMTRARAGHTLTVPFRCDSPELKRYMVLRVTGAAEGAVDFQADVVRTESQIAPLWQRSDTRHEPLVSTCSWCKRVQADGEWLEIEEAVRRLDLLGSSPPRLTHGICEACAAMVMTAITQSTGPDTH